MLGLDSQVYCPVLRLKAGECAALNELAPDVRSRLLPLFVVPPPSEKDTEFGRHLTTKELLTVPARRLERAWPLRPCILDPRFLLEAFDAEVAPRWLPDLFSSARYFGATPWLVADVPTCETNFVDAAKDILGSTSTPFVLRLRDYDSEDASLETRMQRILLKLNRKPAETVLILDFGNSDYSNTEVAAEIIVATVQRVMSIGLWGQIVWHSTSFPSTNPGRPGELVRLPRGESKAFLRAVELDSTLRERLMYGDYCADSAKFQFSSGKGIPAIRHFRYSTSEEWLVSRGKKAGKDAIEMPNVAKRILTSGNFAGAQFSSGDKYIGYVAANLGPGNAKCWRRANTSHHLTRMISDLGALGGYQLAERQIDDPSRQLEFKL